LSHHDPHGSKNGGDHASSSVAFRRSARRSGRLAANSRHLKGRTATFSAIARPKKNHPCSTQLRCADVKKNRRCRRPITFRTAPVRAALFWQQLCRGAGSIGPTPDCNVVETRARCQTRTARKMHFICALWTATELFRPFILSRDKTCFCLHGPRGHR
jgi:hypothetical protein